MIIVATYGLTAIFFHPLLISAAVSPGSRKNSWNINLARRVAVSRDVKQNAEYVSVNNVRSTVTAPGPNPTNILAIPPAKIAVAPFNAVSGLAALYL